MCIFNLTGLGADMKTDRELLELAAKAAGIDITAEGDAQWNPLTDDGDAFRLTVKLEIDLWLGNGGVDAHGLVMDVEEEYGGDPYAATRRAITRAAAKLGASL